MKRKKIKIILKIFSFVVLSKWKKNIYLNFGLAIRGVGGGGGRGGVCENIIMPY